MNSWLISMRINKSWHAIESESAGKSFKPVPGKPAINAALDGS